MEILGVGWQELIFIVIIALIVLGPKDMQKAGKTIGRWLNQLVNSDTWKVFQQTSGELRNLPRNLMKEANMEMQETERELRRTIDQIDPRPNRTVASSIPPASSQSRSRPPSDETENTTQSEPPAVKPTPPHAQAAGSESSAEDGAGSSDSAVNKGKDTAQNTNSEEHG
ncbi:MAG: twin-arginine translocase TatA/TatE family subunit [Anaerolineales bacterium]